MTIRIRTFQVFLHAVGVLLCAWKNRTICCVLYTSDENKRGQGVSDLPSFWRWGTFRGPHLLVTKDNKMQFSRKLLPNFRSRLCRSHISSNGLLGEGVEKVAKFVNFVYCARSKSLIWPPTFECGPQLIRVGVHIDP